MSYHRCCGSFRAAPETTFVVQSKAKPPSEGFSLPSSFLLLPLWCTSTITPVFYSPAAAPSHFWYNVSRALVKAPSSLPLLFFLFSFSKKPPVVLFSRRRKNERMYIRDSLSE